MKTDWIAGFLGTWSTELTLGAILLRLALSMALAAIIGCERSSKRHSAGLRTFILVSLAGTSTMLIDQYLMDVLPITIPVLSAAAVIGITTISGNSILFSSKNQIKGLTTSVGLWCCGIVGLALGAGLYTLALVLFAALLCSMSGLPALETHLKDRSNHFEVHLELKNGAGTIEKRIPAMMRMFAKHGIDIRKEPILVYPTLHYQNGGLHITADGQTDVENLFAAGEVVGGIHGRNRLMGNSLLDVIVFGRNAGQHAAEKAKSVNVGTLTLDHVAAFEAEKQQAGVTDHRLSPQLLPDYARKIHPAEK